MTLYVYVASIVILLGTFIFQIRKPSIPLVLFARWVFWGAGALVFLILCFYSYLQYQAWQANEFTELFFSEGLGYFTRYVLYRFFGQYIVSFIAAIVFLYAARMYNRRHHENIFYVEEPYLVALSIFLVGHPLWILYLGLTAVLYSLFSIGYNARYRKTRRFETPRISFYYGWLPTALFVILMKGLFMRVSVVELLMFAREQFII